VEGRALIPLLADDNTTVRNRALQSIGVLRVHEAGPALREMFVQHRRRELGTRVLAALSRTGDPAQGDLYRELLFSNDPEQRRLAVEGLARIADPSMMPAFKTDFQREKNSDVRMAYGFGIVRLGDRAFLDSLVLALGGTGASAQHARDLILELGPSLAPDLYPYLNDRDPSVRGAVCDLLAALGDTNAAPKLTPLWPTRTRRWPTARTGRSRSCGGRDRAGAPVTPGRARSGALVALLIAARPARASPRAVERRRCVG
jgi:HEAT repeat protein